MSETRYRIHMGCGEPLRSRWWIVRSLREAPVAALTGRRRAQVSPPAGRAAARCKS